MLSRIKLTCKCSFHLCSGPFSDLSVSVFRKTDNTHFEEAALPETGSPTLQFVYQNKLRNSEQITRCKFVKEDYKHPPNNCSNHNMESLRFCRLLFMLTWIFGFFFPSVYSGKDAPKLFLNTTVFVALKGDDLTVNCTVTTPANYSQDKMDCYNPHNSLIHTYEIPQAINEQTQNYEVKLKNLTISGAYYCQCQAATVFWYVQVRDGGYKEPIMHEFIILAVVTGLLLVFSIIGSVYVFRGHWKEQITNCGETVRKGNQTREQQESLEPRPRSIYDVLDHSAANREPNQTETKPKKNKSQKTTEQTTQQNEGVFESVYENF
ncbi:uncharacterized protein si:ch211-243a20.4 isoform X2 [Lates calcarifer]|uniref:Uncharacterized protein si:ch211-243a20.4 isoform X2 n=1 Tax=Lates calcarifer TaxID=8187 RepID=A0AAJ8B7B1_LATCA|nr:uncharacterized protein si:ch211-243a20.4 isoform X2 [Lates calcarifer]